MGLLAIELIKTLDELDPSVRKVFIKILEKIEQTLGEAVKRDDFIRLNPYVVLYARSKGIFLNRSDDFIEVRA